MALRVAFDLDGTLADMFGALHVEATKLFGDVLVHAGGDHQAPAEAAAGRRLEDVEPRVSRLPLDDEQRAALWRRVARIPNFWMTLAEIEPGSLQQLAAVATERRWEVIFLTTRPTVAGATTQVQSQQWLEQQGFRGASVFVVRRSRGRIADALELDAVVDDRPENCVDVALESKAHSILVRRGSETNPLRGAGNLGVRVVASVAEAMALLEKIDDSKRGTRVTRQIRKLFGQKD
ncbi:MAG: hypothetical protein LC791_08345 [Acidobacteria bacterium]|nr:hypothetical protein [Acidobacteriota bacterium]